MRCVAGYQLLEIDHFLPSNIALQFQVGGQLASWRAPRREREEEDFSEVYKTSINPMKLPEGRRRIIITFTFQTIGPRDCCWRMFLATILPSLTVSHDETALCSTEVYVRMTALLPGFLQALPSSWICLRPRYARQFHYKRPFSDSFLTTRQAFPRSWTCSTSSSMSTNRAGPSPWTTKKKTKNRSMRARSTSRPAGSVDRGGAGRTA